jgi:hypothetical protein
MNGENIEWMEPWTPIVDPALRTSLETELRNEVAQGHVLFGRSAMALARRSDQDDVLFAVDNPSQFAVVHLSYAARPDRPPWPDTICFDDVETFVEGRMRPDHEEYISAR